MIMLYIAICHQVLDVYSEEEQKEQNSPVKVCNVLIIYKSIFIADRECGEK